MTALLAHFRLNAVSTWTVALLLTLQGCAMVEVSSLGPREYISMKRGDVLTTGEVSANTQQTTRVAGLDEGSCVELNSICIQALSKIEGLAVDRKLSALAELWLKEAIRLQKSDDFRPEQKLDAWLQTARHAYAYLFYSDRTSSERAFEDRQTQVRDYYNYAVQEAVALLFQQRLPDLNANGGLTEEKFRLGDWIVYTDYNDIRLPEGVSAPKELIRASTLTFKGLRSSYRRDGFGAELVAVLDDTPIQGTTQNFSEMPSPTFTALLHFEGAMLEQVLSTRSVRLSVHDPYGTRSILIKGQTIPLAANFTAGYGLWLARTDFATQSLLTLFGRDAGISKPHIFLMQPYDPNRRILLMLHGLGSSPEAWVNVANEVLGDESLRNEFQVWQVYYPTNIPISFNHAVIRKVVKDTLVFFDPSGKARASRDMVVVGHSMGGVIARLMVSSSGDDLLRGLREDLNADEDSFKAVEDKLKPLVQFEPIPNIGRAVFIAAPHRGTEFAGNRIGRWISSLIKLPLTLLEGFEDVLMTIGRADPKQPDGQLRRIPNSIDNLDQADPFIRAASSLHISPQVPYHSIIAKLKPEVPLQLSNDGVVPYPSAHLDGAQSEKVIVSGHSVQETAAAVLEVRRILHEDVRQHEQDSD